MVIQIHSNCENDKKTLNNKSFIFDFLLFLRKKKNNRLTNPVQR